MRTKSLLPLFLIYLMAPSAMLWGTNLSFTGSAISTSADGAWSVYTADVDGDGDMDVLSASPADDKISISPIRMSRIDISCTRTNVVLFPCRRRRRSSASEATEIKSSVFAMTSASDLLSRRPSTSFIPTSRNVVTKSPAHPLLAVPTLALDDHRAHQH